MNVDDFVDSLYFHLVNMSKFVQYLEQSKAL